MVFLRLFYTDEGRSVNVMDGIASVLDCRRLVDSVKTYVGRIGAPPVAPLEEPKVGLLSLPAIVFHHVGFMLSDQIGEVVISQFSHKSALDAVRSHPENPKVKARTYGVYTSSSEINKRLAYRFVEVIDSIQP